MKTVIYFIRHGDVYNPTDIVYGRLPGFGLSEKGKKQIEQAAKYLKTQNINFLYSSPILRAQQTAEIIQKELGLPKINYSEYITEILTSVQGKTSTYAHKTYPNFDIFAGPGKDITGETIGDVSDRIEQFIYNIQKKYSGKNIVAVTHGDLLMLLKALAGGLPIVIESIRPGSDQYAQKGEIYKVTCDENGQITIESVFKPNL